MDSVANSPMSVPSTSVQALRPGGADVNKLEFMNIPPELQGEMWENFIPARRVFKIISTEESEYVCDIIITNQLLHAALMHDTWAFLSCKGAFHAITNPGSRSLFFKIALVKPIHFDPTTDILWFMNPDHVSDFADKTLTSKFYPLRFNEEEPDAEDFEQQELNSKEDCAFHKSKLEDMSEYAHTVVIGDVFKGPDGIWKAKPWRLDQSQLHTLVFGLSYMGTLQLAYILVEHDDSEGQAVIQKMRELGPSLPFRPGSVLDYLPTLEGISWKDFKDKIANWRMGGELQEFQER